MNERLNFFSANPNAMKTLIGLEQYIGQSTIEPQLAELVRLRASLINGCAFCIDKHVHTARKAGEDERKLATISAWRETSFFSERERAALEWTESVTLLSETRVPDEVWNTARNVFSDQELVDLTLLVAAINAWNRFAVAFRKMPA